MMRLLAKYTLVLSLSIWLFSCSEDAPEDIIDFNTAAIEGNFTADLRIQPPDAAPDISVFGGTLSITVQNSNQFTLIFDYGEDYEFPEIIGNIQSEILSPRYTNMGGVYFEIIETDDLRGDSNTVSVETIIGEPKEVYAYFEERDPSSNEIDLVLLLMDKANKVTRYRFTATKEL